MVFQKGNTLGGRTKGSKNKATLIKEERIAMFDERISQKWPEVIDELRPEYVADQYMGKAIVRVEIKGDINITKEPSKKVKDFLNGLIKR